MEMLEKLVLYFQFPFVRYALIVGILISLCASLIGVTLVLRRFSFIGDGLSHVAFGAMSVAAVVGLTNEMWLVLPITVLSAVLLLCVGQNVKIKGDAAVAILSVGALAIGYLLMNLFSSSTNLAGDVCSTLFGATSILTLTAADVWTCALLAVVVVVVFVLFYNKLFALTFDEAYLRASGGRVRLYNLVLAVVIAVVIVLAMNLVGSLLVSALIIFPAITAMSMFKSFRAVTVCSGVIAVASSAVGIIISIMIGSPVGCTIVAIDLIVLGAFKIVALASRRRV